MKRWIRDNRGLLVFLIGMGLFRTAVADWNPVPTGSMRPTIVEGDVVGVNRLAYDLKVPLAGWALVALGEPQRGDIVTFSSPQDGTRLIKRVVAVAGDTVALRDGRLWLNGQAARYEDPHPVQETVAPGVVMEALRATEDIAGDRRLVQYFTQFGHARSFETVTVPPGHVFVLGDHRDNSHDSRAFGVVPREALTGRAERVLVSADLSGPWRLRSERLGSPLR
jgi:signal peptidase I